MQQKFRTEFQTATIKLCKKHLKLALYNDVSPLLSSIRSQLESLLHDEANIVINQIISSTNTYFNSNYVPKK